MEVAEEMAKKSIQRMNWREVSKTIIRANCPFHDDRIDTLFIDSFPSSTTSIVSAVANTVKLCGGKMARFDLSSDEIKF
jgi:hypothetical protein